jgi:hypothetical protein
MGTLAGGAAVLWLLLLVAGVFYWTAWEGIAFASRLHWGVGIAVAVVLLGGLCAFLTFLRKSLSSPKETDAFWGRDSLARKHPGLSTTISVLVVVLVAILLIETISDLLHTQARLVTYTLPAEGTASGVRCPPRSLRRSL